MTKQERLCDCCGESISQMKFKACGQPIEGEWPTDRQVILSFGMEGAKADACDGCFLKVARMFKLDERPGLKLEDVKKKL